jgi:hypothetical protein
VIIACAGIVSTVMSGFEAAGAALVFEIESDQIDTEGVHALERKTPRGRML